MLKNLLNLLKINKIR